MTGYDVEPPVLQFAGMQLGDVADDLRTEAAPIRAQLDTLLGGQWAGGAARGFEVGWRNWEQGFARVTEALDAMGRLIAETGATYSQTEVTNTGAVETSGAS